MTVFSGTKCARVVAGEVVETGRFAALIAPTSPLAGGMSAGDARDRFGVYAIGRHADEFGSVVVEVGPWLDRVAGEVYETTRSPLVGAGLVAAWSVERDRLVAAVKAAAGAEILARLPEWKQRNLTARGVELLRKIVQATASPAEIAEADAIEAVWRDQVVPVRAHSDQVEAVIALEHDAAMAAYAGDAGADLSGYLAAMRAAAVVTWPAPA